jgi:hypothetical protein
MDRENNGHIVLDNLKGIEDPGQNDPIIHIGGAVQRQNRKVITAKAELTQDRGLLGLGPVA